MRKLFAYALAVILLASCSDQLPGIDLTPSNNGEAIDASAGQIINVKLDSNPTTGFKWNLVGEPDAKVLKHLSSQYVAPAQSSQPIVGAGGNEIWKFQVVGRGTTSLRLAYFRPFAPDDVARAFSVTVNVK